MPGPWKMEVLLLLRAGESDRSGDCCLCYRSKEEEVCCVTQDHTGKRLGQSGGREVGKAEAGAFAVVCTGRTR